MGLFGSIAGALGGLATGGPLGAIAGGVAGWSDGDRQRATSGMNMRAWDPQELEMINGAYGNISAAQAAMNPAMRQGFIDRSAANYFDPMARGITEGYTKSMNMNAGRNARGGMAGSTQAIYGDQAVARGAAGAMSDAVARSRQLGTQDYYSFNQDNRANIGMQQGLINSAWNNRVAGSERWSEQPTGSASTGMGLMGMGIGMGSPYMDKANGWITDGLKSGYNSLFGGGKPDERDIWGTR